MNIAYTLLTIFLSIMAPEKGEIAVIVHKDTPMKSAGINVITNFYKLNIQKWSDGSKIIVCNLKQKGTVKSKFYKHLGIKLSDIRKTWMRYQLTGEGRAPIALKSEKAMLEKVASTPGAIGYISHEHVTDEVKIIAIIK